MLKKPKVEKGSSATRGAVSDSPYLDARVIDIGLLEREQRHAASWRRAFFGAVAIAFISLVTSLVLATKDHTEAVVYKEDASGDIALIGLSSHERIPTEQAVKHQLTVWLESVRDIPGADDDLINRNAQAVLYMTASDSPALTAYKNFVIADNPKKLAMQGVRRTVTTVEINKLADLTYRLSWQEKLRMGNSASSQLQTYSGTVYLVSDPTVPSDPVIGQYNPVGLYIKDFDMNWSILKS